jgi:hypothetical protein
MSSPGQPDSGLLDDLDERRAVLGVLPDGLVIEDDAGDVVAHRFGRAEQELAVVAPVVLGAFGADGVEALLDGAARFVGCKNALAGSDHGGRDLVQLIEVHRTFFPTQQRPGLCYRKRSYPKNTSVLSGQSESSPALRIFGRRR